jgi:hypothetical protein
MRLEIDSKAQEMIDRYMNVKIRGQVVVAPYFRNVKRARAELRSLVGKGTPEEIAEETIIFAQLRGFSIAKSTPAQIREFMQSQGIGIDCSGFIAHIYNYWLKSKRKSGLGKYIKHPPTSLYRKFIMWLRPIENIGANLITCPLNSVKINYQDTLPGDMIRLKGLTVGYHVALITAVEQDEQGNLTKIEYTHSSPHFGSENGVKKGFIEIRDLTKPLEEQNWLETDKNGSKPTLKEYLNILEDNGIVRPNFNTQLN